MGGVLEHFTTDDKIARWRKIPAEEVVDLGLGVEEELLQVNVRALELTLLNEQALD